MPQRPTERKGYYTTFKFPRRRAEKRIKVPQPPKRPFRFNPKSLLRFPFIRKNPWWFLFHRRGVRGRTPVGENPLEARAIPRSLVRGTLPERIIYKFLVEYFHFVPDVDFDFQTSLQGGRIEVGGIVADFLFPILMIVINPLGPTHKDFLRAAKDDEQVMALQELGYQVYMLEEELVYDRPRFEDEMRRIFNWTHGGGNASEHEIQSIQSEEGFMWDKILTAFMEIDKMMEKFN